MSRPSKKKIPIPVEFPVYYDTVAGQRLAETMHRAIVMRSARVRIEMIRYRRPHRHTPPVKVTIDIDKGTRSSRVNCGLTGEDQIDLINVLARMLLNWQKPDISPVDYIEALQIENEYMIWKLQFRVDDVEKNLARLRQFFLFLQATTIP